MKPHKHKEDGLESLVARFPVKKLPRDEKGRRYVPFCDYGWHPGFILKEDVCLKRNCEYYTRLYVNKPKGL